MSDKKCQLKQVSSSFIASEIHLDGNTYVSKLGLLFDCQKKLEWIGALSFYNPKNSDFNCALAFYNAKVLDCIGAMSSLWSVRKFLLGSFL